MSSSKKPRNNKGRQSRVPTSSGLPLPREQGPPQGDDMLLFSYGVPNSAIQARDPHPVNSSQEARLLEDSQQTAGAAQSGFGPHGLDGLGPLYQATQHPHELMPVQGGFSYPPDAFPASSQPSFSTSAASAYPELQPSATPADPIATHWQPGVYSYATNNSPAYSSPQNAPSPYVAGFVSHPPALQYVPQSGFDGYRWPQPGDGSLTLGSNPTSDPLPSPAIQNFETLSVTQGGAFSDSDPAMNGEPETEDWEQQQQQLSQRRTMEPESPRNKRAKKSSHHRSSSSLSTPASKLASKAGTSTGASMSRSEHRRASASASASASKNPPYRPEEPSQDRTRSRSSHNLVEKQYRNRLNMQYENLKNTLPESLRSPTGGFGGGINTSGGDSDGQGVGGSSGSPAHLGAFEAGERQLSKAQVLERSARYIRSLQSETSQLTEEKDQLTSEKEVLLEALRRARAALGGEEREGVEGQEGEGELR